MVDGRGGMRSATLVDQLDHVLTAASSGASELTEPRCQREALALGEIIARTEVEMIRRLVRSHAAGITELSGFLTLDRMLTVNAGLSKERARVLARVVEWSIAFPDTGAALLVGDLPVDHADALARHAFGLTDEYARDEVEILAEVAGLRELADVERVVGAWRQLNDPVGTSQGVQKAFDDRHIRLQPSLFGGGGIKGHLPAGEFDTVASALETNPDAKNGPVEPRSLGQRTADKLVDIASSYLGVASITPDDCACDASTDEHGGDGRNRRPVAIDAVLDIQTILGHDPIALREARRELGRGELVPEDVARQLMCDATFRRVIFDGPNQVLNTGTPTPLIPRSLRRAIQRRDKHCQFAGCRRHWTDCDVHHIHWRRNGGLTDEQNLCLLCPRHHTLVHQAGYHLARDPGSGVILTWLPDMDGDEWALDAEGRWTKASGAIEPNWAEPRAPDGHRPWE